MFNLFDSVYLCGPGSYRTDADQIIMDESLMNIHNIRGDGVRLHLAPDLDHLLHNHYGGNITAFFRKLVSLQTGEKKARSLLIFCRPKDLVRMLACWYRLVFREPNLKSFKELVNIYKKDYDITYCKFRTIKEATADVYLAEFEEASSDEHLTQCFKRANNTVFDTATKQHIQNALPLEYLLLKKAMGFAFDETEMEKRIFRLVSNMFVNNIYRETRSKLLQALPRLDVEDLGYSFDPMDDDSYTRLISQPIIGDLVRTPNVALSRMNDAEYRKVLFEHINKLARHDISGQTNLGYRYFMEYGFNYEGLKQSVLQAKANIVFHERDYYWEEINHCLIGLFVDAVKGNLTDEFKTLLNGLKNV